MLRIPLACLLLPLALSATAAATARTPQTAAPKTAAPKTAAPPAEDLLFPVHAGRCSMSAIVTWRMALDATGYDVQVRKAGQWNDWLANTISLHREYPFEKGERPEFRIRVRREGKLSEWSAPVALTVSAEDLAVLSPVTGKHLFHNEKMALMASPPEDACGIAKVVWQVDGVEVGVATVSPFRLDVAAPTLGRHQVRAVATMADGTEKTSAPVPIRVVKHAYEDRDLEYIVIGPGMPAPPAKSYRKKPGKPAGAAQKLQVCFAQRDFPEPPTRFGGYVGEPLEVVTSDGHPPVNKTLRVPLEGEVFSDAQMRRVRLFRYDEKARKWVLMPGVKLDEETMMLSAPVKAQGYYALAEASAPPTAHQSVRWITPAEGATVKGRQKLLVQVDTDDIHSIKEFTLERLGDPVLQMVYEGSSPHPLGPIPQAWPLSPNIDWEDELGMTQHRTFTTQPGEVPERPESQEDHLEGELPFDFSLVPSGAYRLVAEVSGAGEKLWAARVIHVESSLKPPTVTLNEQSFSGVRSSTGSIGGTVTPGTLPVKTVCLFWNGILIGVGEIQEPDPETLTAPPTGPMRWTGTFDMVANGPLSVTAIAMDAMGNRSEPATFTKTLPLRMTQFYFNGPAEGTARLGAPLHLTAWVLGGELPMGTEIRFEVSRDGGKTWKPIRGYDAKPEFTWRPGVKGTYRLRALARNGSETAQVTHPDPIVVK